MIQKFYIRKLKLLPTNLSVNADPTKMLEAIKEEEADLSTPVQQKLLKTWVMSHPKENRSHPQEKEEEHRQFL